MDQLLPDETKGFIAMKSSSWTIGRCMNWVVSSHYFKCVAALAMFALTGPMLRADYTAYGYVTKHYTLPGGGKPLAGATVSIFENRKLIGRGQTNSSGQFQIYCRTKYISPYGTHSIKAVYGSLSGEWGRNMISSDPRHPINLGIR